MQPREKLLAGIVGGLLLLFAGYALLGRVSTAFSERQSRVAALEGEIGKKKGLEFGAKIAAEQLSEWEHRSLPSNLKLAGTLYQNWLTNLADKVKLANVNIDAARPTSHKKIYHKLPFSLQCRGTLTQTTAFLHEFYSANHLHQIREMAIKPNDNAKDLELTFTIEALVLPGADRVDRLNSELSTRLVSRTVDEYNATIVRRNLFAHYAPPAPPRPQTVALPPEPSKPKPGFNPAKFAVLTGITAGEDGPEAWISVKTSGESLRLHEGDKVKVGEFEGVVVQIGDTDVEFDSGGKRRLLLLGKSLEQTLELAAEDSAVDAPASESPAAEKPATEDDPPSETAAQQGASPRAEPLLEPELD